MLKGYLDCTEINKLLISYINFNLNKKDMAKIATHLRNCPKCMEKYSTHIKRKKELNEKMHKIQKALRMQMEISSYLDKEASDNISKIVEIMIESDNKYKKELMAYASIGQNLKQIKSELRNNSKPKETYKIIAKLKNKEKRINTFFKLMFQPVQLLCRGFLKFE